MECPRNQNCQGIGHLTVVGNGETKNNLKNLTGSGVVVKVVETRNENYEHKVPIRVNS